MMDVLLTRRCSCCLPCAALSQGLLGFVWLLAVLGIGAAFLLPSRSKAKGKVSLVLYLLMGYSALICMKVERTSEK
jgi:predicted membrane channel-forming protein YqfA (hemolysin III family)